MIAVMIRPAHTFAAIGCALWATSATAQNGVMAVRATVVESCEVRAGPMLFGTLESGAPQRSAEAQLSVACTPGTAFAVALDNGINAVGGQRQMRDAGGTKLLAYDIYHDAAGTQRWSTTAPSHGFASTGAPTTLTAYGRVTASRAAAGEYGDVVTVSIAF